jgi:hypothetical protein
MQSSSFIKEIYKETPLEQIFVNSNFKITQKRLLKLQEIEADFYDEDEINSPSEYAFSTSKKLIDELYKILNDDFPLGFSSLDSRGGINLIWRNKIFDKEVKIKIPVNNQLESYVYYYQGDESRLKTIIVDTSLNFLASLLLWLSNNNSLSSV